MAIKDILLQLTGGEDCKARIETAVALARRHDAHLTGLYVMSVPELPVYVQSQISIDLIAHQRALFTEQANAAIEQFSHVAEQAGINFETRCVEDHSERVVCLHARYSDLLIIGKRGSGSINLVESVVIDSGKPVLVLPASHRGGEVARHIALAWNGSREAGRAVDAARGLLSAADRVDVLEVDPAPQPDERLAGAEICTHLARHGIKANAEGLASEAGNVGQVLLSRAMSDGADLLVMGAWGHSRLRELVLGGATEHVLRNAEMAVLMVH